MTSAAAPRVPVPSARLHVVIVTPEGPLFDGEAEQVTLPGHEGQMGILPHHAALVTLLRAGAVVVRSAEGIKTYHISGGLAEVVNNQATVLVDSITG